MFKVSDSLIAPHFGHTSIIYSFPWVSCISIVLIRGIKPSYSVLAPQCTLSLCTRLENSSPRKTQFASFLACVIIWWLCRTFISSQMLDFENSCHICCPKWQMTFIFLCPRVNCSFYFKIGACRHGDRCSRLHNKPTFSQVTFTLPSRLKMSGVALTFLSCKLCLHFFPPSDVWFFLSDAKNGSFFKIL